MKYYYEDSSLVLHEIKITSYDPESDWPYKFSFVSGGIGISKADHIIIC